MARSTGSIRPRVRSAASSTSPRARATSSRPRSPYKGNFFVGNLGTFPVVPGTETVFKLTPSGNLKPWATGLTTILGIAFDGRDRMYVLETSNHAGAPAPGNGDIVRIDPSGAQTTIVSGLTFPTGMTMGPDGALYVSNQGFGPLIPGFGQILRIDPN
jgi:hypothetical protein